MKRFNRSKALVGAALAASLILSGCGDSDNFVFTNGNTNNPVAAVPLASNDAFNALGNATINRAADGVLANDTLNGATISAFDAAGSNGGTIALNPDGSFDYTPVPGFVGAETFTYTLENGQGTSTATVTMTSTGLGHFVDNTSNPGGTGTQADPFDTLAAAINAANAGDTIVVNRGDGTSNGINGAIALPAGVDLIGEGAGLFLAQTILPAGQAPLLTGPITCGGSNTISGFTIDGSASEAIIINGVGDVTVLENTISNPTNEHILCTNVTGTNTISNNTFSQPPSLTIDYITAINTDTNGDIAVTNNIFTNDADNDVDGCFEVDALGTSAMSLTFSGNDAIGAAADIFYHGFYIDCEDTSDVTVTVDDNDLTNFEFEPIGVHANSDDAALGGSITNNRITNVSDDDGIDALINNDTITISGNTVTNVSEDGIELQVGAGDCTFIVTDNTVSGAGEEGIEFDEGDDGDINLAVRNNTVTSSANNAFDFDWDGMGTVCIDFTGNTVDGNVRFDVDNGFDMNVEQLADLADNALTGNTFTNPAVVDNVNNAADDVPDGTCQLP